MKSHGIARFRHQVSRNIQCAGKEKTVTSKSIIQRASLQSNTNVFNSTVPSVSAPRLHHKFCQPQRSRLFTSWTASAFPNARQNNLIINLGSKGSSKSGVEVDPILVRDSCRCQLCVDPASQQKLFQTADIPAEVSGRIIDEHSFNDTDNAGNDGTDGDANRVIATISWTHDIPGYPAEHRTELTAEMFAAMVQWNSSNLTPLESSSSSESEIEHTDAMPARVTFTNSKFVNPEDSRFAWNAAEMARNVQWFDYDAYVRSDKTLFAVLEALRVYGLVFLRGVPESVLAGTKQPAEGITVESIAERIGPLRNSFYGRSWDVRSVPGAANVAYTHRYLGLHMDLL